MDGDTLTKELSRLSELGARQTTILESLKEMTSDHERRIRQIERVIGYGLGALGFAKIVWDLLHK